MDAVEHCGRGVHAVARSTAVAALLVVSSCASVDPGALGEPHAKGAGDAGLANLGTDASEPDASGATMRGTGGEPADDAAIDMSEADAGDGCSTQAGDACPTGCLELCNGEDDDCDGRVDEDDADADCARPHTIAFCHDAACRVVGCDDDWVDCDGAADNGCEADTRSVDHCGACFHACHFDGTVALCVDGQCAPGACLDGLGDCDGDPATGCETSLTSLADCGACGASCDIDHASETCAGGHCEIGACEPGWGDCDDDPDTCERPLDTTDDCGACGNDCSLLPHTDQASCQGAASCRIDACAADFSDDNGLAADGCETSIALFQSDAGESDSVRSNHSLSTVDIAVGTGACGPYNLDNRGIVSFDTSGLPDTALAVRAFVTLRHNATTGTPWSGGRFWEVDVKQGCFGGGCSIAGEDYDAAATATGVATVAEWGGGTQPSTDFSAEGMSAINPLGRTQLRVRFDQKVDCRALGNFVEIYGDSSSTLTVHYRLP